VNGPEKSGEESGAKIQAKKDAPQEDGAEGVKENIEEMVVEGIEAPDSVSNPEGHVNERGVGVRLVLEIPHGGDAAFVEDHRILGEPDIVIPGVSAEDGGGECDDNHED